MPKIEPEGGFRTPEEKVIGRRLETVFTATNEGVAGKLEHFTKYVRRQRLTRLFSLYELFKKILLVKGSIIECGVYKGFGIMAWAHISAILEPINLTRRIYGFDTFKGFTETGEHDGSVLGQPEVGQLKSDSFDELADLIKIYDANRFLGHMEKVRLIKGDALQTIPEFVSQNKHLIVSLLFLDFDLYEPTKTAIEHFLPRMPRGAVIAFDELDNPLWPGETLALLNTIGIHKLKIERLDFDPYIGFICLD